MIQGPGITIDSAGVISVNASTVIGLVKLNNLVGYNAYVWPSADGAASTFLKTDGAGNLSWAKAGVTVSSTAPASPSIGDQWFDCATGELKVWESCTTGVAQWSPANVGLPVLPINTTASPAFTGGSGTAASPYLCTATTTPSGSTTLIVNTVTITGLAPFQFVPIQDLDSVTNGGRFSFTNSFADAAGTLVFNTVFRDLPSSVDGTSFTANIKVGIASVYISSVVTITATLALVSPGSLSGTPSVGATITYTQGSYSGGTAPVTESWVWTNGVGSVLQTGGLTYVILPADAGSVIKVDYTATDSIGSTVSGSTSNFPSSGSITSISLVSPGSIAGTPNVGQTLTYTTGSATGGTAPYTYTWVWKDDTGTVLQTGGATYVVLAAQVGKTIKVTLTATDATSQAVSGDTSNFPSSGTITVAPFPNTIFSPATGPTSIPGTATGTWADGSTTLTSTGCIEFSVAGGAYSQGPTAVADGQTVDERWSTGVSCGGAANGTVITGSLTDGTYTNDYTFTVDKLPNSFVFTPSTNIALSGLATSAAVTPTGYNTTAYVTYGASSTGTTIEGSLDGGTTWVAIPTSGTSFPIDPSQSLQVRQTVGTTPGIGYTAVIRIGDGVSFISATYTATTVSTATFPNLPGSLTSGPTATPPTAAGGTVSGTWADGSTTITSTGCMEISLDNVTWGTGPLAMSNGLTLYERWSTSVACGDAADGTTITGTITDGVLTNNFSLTIERNPDTFTLSALTNQALSSTVSSNTVTLSGSNAPTYLTYTAGATSLTNVKVSINGAAFVTLPTSGTTVSAPPGATLQFQGDTGAANSTAYTITVNAGTTTAGWSVTTAAVVASITTPSITAPINGATALNPALNSPAAITLTGSTYTPLNGAGAVQTSSTWEVYRWVGGGAATAPTLEPPGANYAAVTGSPFTVSAASFTTASVPQAALVVSSTYYARVKYATTNTTAATSSFSAWSSFATASSFAIPAGTAMGGGYFGGQINDGGTVYNLIVAPLTSGGLNGQNGGSTPLGIQYRTTDFSDTPTATVQNQVYGGPTTNLFKASAVHPAFSTFINGATGPNAGAFNLTTGGAGGGTGIGGFNDWYLPAKKELEILYFNLKPTTTSNNTASGINPNAVPARASNYTAGSPAQTISALFAGGAQAFTTGGGYRSSSEDVSLTTEVWLQAFGTGIQVTGVKTNSGGSYARAIRRVLA